MGLAYLPTWLVDLWSHTIHVMYGIFTYMNGWFYGLHVGKYTSPMDGMGLESTGRL